MNDSSNNMSLGNRLFLAVVITVSVICVGMAGRALYQMRTHHIGTFTSTGPTLGDWTMDVDVCHTGSRQNFKGAMLYSKKDDRLVVWMVEDPLRGIVASVNSTTTHEAINMDSSNCSVLAGGSEDLTTNLRPPTVIAGKYTVDCTMGGSHFAGQVEFDRCL